MKRDRTLYEHETYLRAQSRRTNMATSGEVHSFPPTGTRDAIFRASAFSLTIAGNDLFRNYHRFGNGDGLLTLELLIKDELGVLWDQLSMKRTLLSDKDWTAHGTGRYVSAAREATATRPKVRLGVLEPTFHQYLASYTFSEVLDPGPSWISSPIPIENDQIVTVAWEAEDAFDERGNPLDAYRIDLEVERLKDDGTTDKLTLCLTHWDSSPIPDPLPLPKTIPLDRTSPTPFGVPIPEVFRKRQRAIGVVEDEQERPVRAIKAKVVISFDAADRRLAQHYRYEDLHLRPPGIRNTAIYSQFDAGTSDEGRRRAGEFRSFRELVEFSGGILDGSQEDGYDGDDIAFLMLPIFSQFSSQWGEEIRDGSE
jgi:hypothetical protein